MSRKKVDLSVVVAGLLDSAMSDAVDHEIEFQHGINCGRQWVAEQKPGATPEALARLSKLRDGLGTNARYWFCDDSSSKAFSTDERVFFVLVPEMNGKRTESMYFWESVADDLTPAPWVVEGFVEGALAAWNEMTPAP